MEILIIALIHLTLIGLTKKLLKKLVRYHNRTWYTGIIIFYIIIHPYLILNKSE